MEFKYLMIFGCVLAACLTVGLTVHESRSARDCWGGVYDLAERSAATCEGARVSIEERGGKRYAVCTCESATTPDSGPLAPGATP